MTEVERLAQIAAMMKEASALKPAGSLRPHTYTTLIGLLASCGLRPGEAVRLRDADVELVVLAGFMRVLHEPMLKAFPRRIINIHPSLLPKFPGLEAWKQALIAGETATGCTVHYVDERIDHGQILAQKEVRILPNDTAESLHARIQVLEHGLYPAVIAEFCERYAKASEQAGV